MVAQRNQLYWYISWWKVPSSWLRG